MAEGEILQEQIGIASQERADEAEEQVKGFGHRARVAEPAGASPPESPAQQPSACSLASGFTFALLHRELSRRILTRHGYRVIDASGAGQALELYEKHAESIDLLLTDVVMPQMTGKALAERIRQQRPGIRVLYMSGYPEDVIAYQGTVAEGIDLVQKPFNEESLLRAVKRLLTGSAGGQSTTDETQPGIQAA